jgi:hypothetical protein
MPQTIRHLSSLNAAYLQRWAQQAAALARDKPQATANSRMAQLMLRLGLKADTAAAPLFVTSIPDEERAAVTIETWLSYLPTDCVRSMVQRGWHWSTESG